MIELGLLEAAIPETRVVVDTPSGSWETVAQVRKNISPDGRRFRVESVAIRPEIAFAFLLDQPLQVPNLGNIRVDVSFTGGFFVMVSADQIDLELSVENAPQLARLGMDIIEAGNVQLEVQHPQREYINTIDVVEFFDPRGHDEGRGKNFVVLGEGHVDRSPCGTGTCAKLALLHERKQLDVGEAFINEGLLGTTFDAHIVRESSIKNPETGESLPAIIPEISGAAHITGLQNFVLTPEDPFPEGFLIQA
jgi:proline racemase